MSALHEAAKKRDIQEVKNLISQGSKVNEFDDDGHTPLHSLIIEFVVFGNYREAEQVIQIMDLLLEAGADINAKEKSGQKRTILHWVAESKDEQLTKQILKRKANVNSTNFFNDTPLHLAVSNASVRASDEEQLATVKTLLEFGADINAVNDAGFRPTTTTETSENPTLHALLLEYGVPSMEKTKGEKELRSLLDRFSNLFTKPEAKKIYEAKTLRDLSAEAAIKIRYTTNSKSEYYKKLLLLNNHLRETYPELEFDYKKLFIHKVNKVLERNAKNLDEKTHAKEFTFLKSLRQAIHGKNPYNDVHKILQEIDKEFKKAFLSNSFKDIMKPIREQIVQAMKEYNEDKKLYVEHTAPKPV